MKLKGKATFELTNVETGEKRVVKEENMVTNAFQYLMQTGTLGEGPYTRLRDGISSYYNVMTGTPESSWCYPIQRYTNGLLLFEGPLEEDPDHVFVTADDPELTGVGSRQAYLGNQLQAGSYNITESGPIEGGYKHVWDFTTSQANGDIGCACLTSLQGAGLGGGTGLATSVSDWYGSLSSEYFSYGPNFYLPYYEDYYNISQSWAIGYIDIGRNLFIRPKEQYSMPSNSGTTSTLPVQNEFDANGLVVTKKVFDRSFIYKKSIDLDIFRFPFNNYSIFDEGYYTKKSRKYSGTTTGTVYNGQVTKIDTVTVQMPTGLANLIPDDIVQASINTNYYWPTDINYDEGFMYISFIIPKSSAVNTSNTNYGCNVESGDKIYVWKINMITFESSYFVITNTTGTRLAFSVGCNTLYNPQYKNVVITNNYTLLSQYPGSFYGKMWIIDNATGSTIKEAFQLYNDTVFSKSDTYRLRYIRDDIAYFFYLPSSADNTNLPIIVLNLKTGAIKWIRAYGIGMFYSNCLGNHSRTFGTKHPLLFRQVHTGSGNGTYYCYLNFMCDPTFLLTINNLEDVVTKTSAETMKVTYVLTQSEDEE